MTYVHPRAYLLRRRYPALEWEDGVRTIGDYAGHSVRFPFENVLCEARRPT